MTQRAMPVRVLLFGPFREAAGAESLQLVLREGAAVRDLIAALSEEGPLGEGARAAAVAVNRRYAGPDERLEEGDEIALIPPVAGG